MRQLTRRWRRATVLTIVGLALAAGSTACSGGASSSSSAGVAQGGKAAPAQPVNPAAPGADAGQGAAGQGANAGSGAKAGPGANAKTGVGGKAQSVPDAVPGKPGEAASIERDIIYHGSMTMRVDNVDGAATRLEQMATAAGGFVGGDTREMNAGHSTATLVLRIPAARFGGFLDDVGRQLGGREVSRKVSADDATETVIDLDARIQSQQASVDRVRALLAKARSLGDITSIESQLTQRESDLESMEAQRRNLADLTELSTVTVSLLGPQAAAVNKPEPKSDNGFWAGLKGGWHAFVGALRVLLLIVGAVLPFAIVAGLALLVVLWVRRRRRATRAPVPAAPDAPVG